jgi:hypothetical protein
LRVGQEAFRRWAAEATVHTGNYLYVPLLWTQEPAQKQADYGFEALLGYGFIFFLDEVGQPCRRRRKRPNCRRLGSQDFFHHVIEGVPLTRVLHRKIYFADARTRKLTLMMTRKRITSPQSSQPRCWPIEASEYEAHHVHVSFSLIKEWGRSVLVTRLFLLSRLLQYVHLAHGIKHLLTWYGCDACSPSNTYAQLRNLSFDLGEAFREFCLTVQCGYLTPEEICGLLIRIVGTLVIGLAMEETPGSSVVWNDHDIEAMLAKAHLKYLL